MHYIHETNQIYVHMDKILFLLYLIVVLIVFYVLHFVILFLTVFYVYKIMYFLSEIDLI